MGCELVENAPVVVECDLWSKQNSSSAVFQVEKNRQSANFWFPGKALYTHSGFYHNKELTSIKIKLEYFGSLPGPKGSVDSRQEVGCLDWKFLKPPLPLHCFLHKHTALQNRHLVSIKIKKWRNRFAILSSIYSSAFLFYSLRLPRSSLIVDTGP